MIALILASLVALTLGQTTPRTPCCTDHQYEVGMGKVGGSVYTEHGHLTQNWIDGFNVLHRDSFNQLLAVESHKNLANGSTSITKVLLDYQHQRTYIQSNGGCYHIPLKSAMRDSCIPPTAKYLGESYMGYGMSQMKLQNWEIHPARTDISLRITMTVEGCVPVTEAFVGHTKMHSPEMQEVNFLYIFNGYRTGLRNPDVFKVPQHCRNGPSRRSQDDFDLTPIHHVFSD